MMLKRILAIALLLCVVSVYALADGAVQTAPPESTPAPEEENAAGSGAEPEATPVPAPGYILVRWSTGVGWLPLPREGEYSYPLTQLMPGAHLMIWSAGRSVSPVVESAPLICPSASPLLMIRQPK